MQCKLNLTYDGMVRIGSSVAKVEQYAQTFKAEVASIGVMKMQMKEVSDETTQQRSLCTMVENKLSDCQLKIANHQLTFSKRFDDIIFKIRKIDEFVHQPNDFNKKLETAVAKVNARLTNKINELTQLYYEGLYTKDQEIKSLNETTDELAARIERCKDEMTTLKGTQGTLDSKFGIYEKVLVEFNTNIDELKTHCLTTDLHLESSLPL